MISHTNYIQVSPQIIAVIVLLNLLIALMNSTVQRVQEEKESYWKFARASEAIVLLHRKYAKATIS